MEGYSHVFNKSIEKFKGVTDLESLFSSFRSQRDIYGFTENMDFPPDEEAVRLAKQINLPLYNDYVKLLDGRKAGDIREVRVTMHRIIISIVAT